MHPVHVMRRKISKSWDILREDQYLAQKLPLGAKFIYERVQNLGLEIAPTFKVRDVNNVVSISEKHEYLTVLLML